MFAGQLSVQRPQTAHAKPSSSLLPGEVLYPGRAEAIRRLQVQGGGEGAPGLQRAGQEADGRGHDVHVLRQRDEQGESQDHPEVQPPGEALQAPGQLGADPRVGDEAA